MSYRHLTEGTLGELVQDLAANERTGPRYIQKAWVIGAVRCLRDARKRSGKTQADLAEALGTTQSAIARLENDRSGRINLRRFAEYAVACGYAPLDIVLEPLEDVLAFASASPGRSRSPIAFHTWIVRNNLLTLTSPAAPGVWPTNAAAIGATSAHMASAGSARPLEAPLSTLNVSGQAYG